jgi:hypothetical protein
MIAEWAVLVGGRFQEVSKETYESIERGELNVGDWEASQTEKEGRLFDPGSLPDEKAQAVAELAMWLEGLRERELSETLRKAAQYNNTDLIVVGQTMGTTLGIPVADERTAIQLGCAFFALGKVARVIGAIAGGGQPQADSWYDLHIYGIMGLKTHETGKWA